MEPFTLSAESLNKIIQLVGNIAEVLCYFQESLNKKIEQIKQTEEYAKLMTEIDQLVELAKFQEDKKLSVDIWSGLPHVLDRLKDVLSNTEFSSFQEFLVTRLINKVPEGLLTMNCLIEDTGEYKRSYLIAGKEVNAGEIADAIDALFNAWLAKPENSMVMQDGFIREGNKNGQVIQDAASSDSAKKRAEKIKKILEDPEHGFARYFMQKKPNAKIEIKRIESGVKQELQENTSQIATN